MFRLGGWVEGESASLKALGLSITAHCISVMAGDRPWGFTRAHRCDRTVRTGGIKGGGWGTVDDEGLRMFRGERRSDLNAESRLASVGRTVTRGARWATVAEKDGEIFFAAVDGG